MKSTTTRVLVNRKSLVEALNVANKIVPARSPKPILEHVQFDYDPAVGGGACLVATDLDVGVRVAVDGVSVQDRASTEPVGGIMLDVKRALAMLRASRDDEVTLAIDGDKVVFYGATTSGTLPLAYAAADFPSVPRFGTPECYAQVESEAVRRLVGRTARCTDVEATRFALGGVMMESRYATTPDLLDAVAFIATDGKRLAIQVESAVLHGDRPGDPPPKPKAKAKKGKSQPAADPVVNGPWDVKPIISLRAIKLLDYLAGHRCYGKSPDGKTTRINVMLPNAVSIGVGGVEVYARNIEGRFPRYEDCFSKEPAECSVTFKVEDLLGRVKQVLPLVEEGQMGIDLSVERRGDRSDATIRYRNHARGDFEAAVPHVGCTSPDGFGYDVCIDASYLADSLGDFAKTGAEEVEMRLIDPCHAVELRTTDGTALLIMPLTNERLGKERRLLGGVPQLNAVADAPSSQAEPDAQAIDEQADPDRDLVIPDATPEEVAAAEEVIRKVAGKGKKATAKQKAKALEASPEYRRGVAEAKASEEAKRDDPECRRGVEAAQAQARDADMAEAMADAEERDRVRDSEVVQAPIRPPGERVEEHRVIREWKPSDFASTCEVAWAYSSTFGGRERVTYAVPVRLIVSNASPLAPRSPAPAPSRPRPATKAGSNGTGREVPADVAERRRSAALKAVATRRAREAARG